MYLGMRGFRGFGFGFKMIEVHCPMPLVLQSASFTAASYAMNRQHWNVLSWWNVFMFWHVYYKERWTYVSHLTSCWVYGFSPGKQKGFLPKRSSQHSFAVLHHILFFPSKVSFFQWIDTLTSSADHLYTEQLQWFPTNPHLHMGSSLQPAHRGVWPNGS